MTGPTDRSSVAGSRYLDLRKAAAASGRPTDELLQFYALEGFLDRLIASRHAPGFVLKGGFLLPAFTDRRPTRDLDLSARAVDAAVPALVSVTEEILAIELDDGLEFDLGSTTGETIREDDDYAGVRISVRGQLARARLVFHVDINVGDPIWPKPGVVELPRVLGGEPIHIIGYSIEMVLAEKLVTALQRGTANTRWRDFVDIAGLSQTAFDIGTARESVTKVAEHRGVALEPLDDLLAGYGVIAQSRWLAWRRKQRLEASTPESFGELLAPTLELAATLFAAQP